VLAVLFLVNVLNFYDRQALGAVLDPLRREFHLSDARLGALTTIFTVLYAVAGLAGRHLEPQAPVGYWGDVVGQPDGDRRPGGQLCDADGHAAWRGDRRSGVRARGHQLDRRPGSGGAARAPWRDS